ncbi:MAG: hypothetical protein M3220_11805 [Chloroflexota bacterium]|nr:hypothetical protein [Chloroflexota bacterium]
MRWLLFVCFLIVLSFFLLSHTSALPAAAEESACTNNLYQVDGGNFWVGSVTAINRHGPVVVLVHGYSSSHLTWIGNNQAVQRACENGFRVTAVDLGPYESIWSNGALLKSKLEAIRAYYGVSSVNIMAHSKGGVDTQTAIVHYAAYPLVQSYIAFGSPFGGTELANYACSWMGQLLGLCDSAVQTITTGYMSFVRSVTDGRPENDRVSGYLARGSECAFFPLSLGCLLIPGPDDSVIPTWSAYGTIEAEGISDRADLNHVELHYLQQYDPSIFSYLGNGTNHSVAERQLATKVAPFFATSDYVMRGGELAGRVMEMVAVEAGVDAVTFRLLSNGAAHVVVVSPGGTRYGTQISRSEPDAILRGVFHEVRIEQPEAGHWRVIATPGVRGKADAYLLHAIYEGGVTVQLDADLGRVYQPGSQLPLAVTAEPRLVDATLDVSIRGAEMNQTVDEGREVPEGSHLALPSTSGIYHVDLHVTGTTIDGSTFERSIVTSIAVVDVSRVKDPATIR